MSEPAPAGATVIRPPVARARRAGRTGPTVTLLVVAVILFMGDAVLLAGVAVLAGLVAYPVLVLAARRAERRQPDWIEVRPDRISAGRSTGDGTVLVRRPDAVLAVHEHLGEQRLRVVSRTGEIDEDSIGLGRYDVERVTAAAVAHGWRLAATAPDGESSEQRTSPEPAADETLIELRDGPVPSVVNPRIVVGLIIALVLVSTALALFGVISPTAMMVMMVGGSVFTGLGIASAAVLAMRRTPLSIVVGRDRLVLVHRELSQQIVKRSAVATASAGGNWLRLRTHQGKQLIWVPLKPRRDEVLATFQRYGWPITDRR